MIAFVGSVFSPYYAWSGRADPDDHVCINVALYGPGANRWSMTERGRAASTRSVHSFAVGPSALCWQDGRLVLDFDEWSLPFPPRQFVPRRMRGRMVLDAGPITQDAFSIDSEGRHRWWPIAPGSRMAVTFEGGAIPDWQGHGYMDCNWGETGLEDAFRRWDWARGELPNGDVAIIYDTERLDGSAHCLSLRIAGDGSVSPMPVPDRTSLGRGLWGVERVGHADAGAKPKLVQSLEDGPFYCRSLVSTVLAGEPVTLMHESFSGERYAKTWVKALLPFRMPRRRG